MSFGTLLVTHLTPQVLHTLIAIVVISIAALVVYLLFKRKFESPRQLTKFRSRLTYVAVCIFIIVATQIWIEGLTYVFTILGLVAAGLVVSNKETIMNFIGFLIINWRGIFTEGDFIQVQTYIGYVASIHPLYFKLYETTSLDQQQATGKMVKIPNGLIITQPSVIFSPEHNVALQRLRFIIGLESDCRTALTTAEETIKDLLATYYAANSHFKKAYLSRRNKLLASLIDLHPKVYVQLLSDKGKGLTVCVDYYAYAQDSTAIETDFWQAIIPNLKDHNITIVV